MSWFLNKIIVYQQNKLFDMSILVENSLIFIINRIFPKTVLCETKELISILSMKILLIFTLPFEYELNNL